MEESIFLASPPPPPVAMLEGADTFTSIVPFLSTSDVKSCSAVSTNLQRSLHEHMKTTSEIIEHGTAIKGASLMLLVQQFAKVPLLRMDVSLCKELTKAAITSAVAACPALQELVALGVGPGSWASKHLTKLLAGAPASLKSVRIDVLLEMKNDLHDGSELLSALSHPAVRVEKLTLISDNVTCGKSMAAADAVGDEAAAAIGAVDIGDPEASGVEESFGDAGDEDATAQGEAAEGLARLARALLPACRSDAAAPTAPLLELDASSGALDVAGAASRLLVPLLTVPGCALACLAICRLSRSAMSLLATAVSENASLQTLTLPSNMIMRSGMGSLAAGLTGHATLTALNLDHNPILDPGGETLAAILPTTRLASLSLNFTGVANGTCRALAAALSHPDRGCRLRSLRLSGNRLTSDGVSALASSLGGLISLDLTANLHMDSDGTCALAKALPGSSLRALALAGCKVDKKACGRLAAALVQSRLTHLDLSSNHFGNGGSDELAWVLGACESLEALNLADCTLEDEAADELLEALTDDDAPVNLAQLDLRWNKLTAAKHQGGKGISADARVNASSQKQQTASERQTAYLEHTFQQAKQAGKKVYVPKWLREQQKAQGGGRSAGTGSAMA